ncbi:MAG: PilZ domain-containing protein [Candidatus Eremiobacteraeota bacterium]|nr:PilZ domain-containing protein [Candidatus Eremiobacteraeota bacterium]MBV8643721.1 PilZ domain-containing protein [Candidatus Eremiobacteraeota bacterium]
MSDEKRAEDSVRLRKFIDVIIEDQLSFTLFRGAIADISISGMRVISDQYLPKGTRYTFTMKRAPFIVVRGEVRWIRAFERDTFQVGVQFVGLPEEDHRKLQSFLEIERQRVPTS